MANGKGPDKTDTSKDKPARDPITYRIIGAYLGVYRTLGWGFLEAVYRRAMVVALRDAGAAVAEEVPLVVRFRGNAVGEYRADLIVDDQVIVEVKCVSQLGPIHRAQLLNYLKATPYERGLLLNFGPKPEFERLIFTTDMKQARPMRL